MAVDYFLKIAEAPGESEDQTHGGEIDLLSWSWGETQTGVGAFGGGHGGGKVSMQDFHFVMKMNKASAPIMAACAGGTHFKTAILTCRKAGDKPIEYLKITFTDVMVSSYQTGGSSAGDEVPLDQIALNYSKIEWEYFPQKADGSQGSPVKGGFDVKKNVKV